MLDRLQTIVHRALELGLVAYSVAVVATVVTNYLV